MSTFTGYKCDVCGKASDSHDGWLKLNVHTRQDVRPSGGWDDICSNQCLANLALDRLRDMDGVDMLSPRPSSEAKKTRRVYTDEEKQLVIMRATEVGLKAATEEFGVPYTTAFRWPGAADVPK